MNLALLLQRIARMDPQRPAIYSGSRQLATYAQWAARSARLARRLRGLGLQPGDRVALFMHNHPRYLEVMFGAWWAGLAVVPINAKLHLREAQWIVDNAQASWVFVTLDTAPADAQSRDLAQGEVGGLWCRAPAPYWTRWRSMPCAWRRSHASSGPNAMKLLTRCPRTTMAKCSRPSCASGLRNV